tara:strand:+ start:192 stop:356 length:165 start_codon:yes stop_codon:yes gene_type:complete
MNEFFALIKDFLRENAVAIIIVSLIISLVSCYFIIFDVKFPKSKYIKKRIIVIE